VLKKPDSALALQHKTSVRKGNLFHELTCKKSSALAIMLSLATATTADTQPDSSAPPVSNLPISEPVAQMLHALPMRSRFDAKNKTLLMSYQDAYADG